MVSAVMLTVMASTVAAAATGRVKARLQQKVRLIINHRDLAMLITSACEKSQATRHDSMPVALELSAKAEVGAAALRPLGIINADGADGRGNADTHTNAGFHIA